MPEYHVGCGAFGIYAGTLNPKNKNMWKNKTECTQEAIEAVIDHIVLSQMGGYDNPIKSSGGFELNLKDGRTVKLELTIK